MNQITPSHLRRDAEHLAGGLPPLLAEAQRLASSVMMGVHGRKRAGTGENFWQYRNAMPGDDLAAVDWRRSARSDNVYIRQNEWEAAHTVALWCDTAKSMDYSGDKKLPTKQDRARLLTMALAVLLSKAGERVALPATLAAEPKTGERHLQRIALALSADETADDYGHAPDFMDTRAARSVFISDFLGPEDDVLRPMRMAAENAGIGCIVQVLAPSEESFPFDGRVIFESMGGAIEFETHRAKALRDEYKERLARRIDMLQSFARETGWRYVKHHTSDNATNALLWLYMAIGGLR